MKWLLKSDPDTYGFAELERDGKTRWDGVSNPVALKHLRAIVRGDSILIYHTGEERAVVGTAEAVSDAYPDPKLDDPRRAVVDVKVGSRLPRPVTLAEVKKQASLKDFDLVRLPRLSVMPVSDAQWKVLMELAEKPAVAAISDQQNSSPRSETANS